MDWCDSPHGEPWQLFYIAKLVHNCLLRVNAASGEVFNPHNSTHRNDVGYNCVVQCINKDARENGDYN